MQEERFFLDDRGRRDSHYFCKGGNEGQFVALILQVVKSEPWPCVFKRHSGDAGGGLNYLEHEQVKKRMLLERFQEEYGGFDFSGAEV